MSGVFVCYRRQPEVEHAAGRLHDALEREFGADSVFMDVDSINPGDLWMDAINAALSKVDVLLAIIHPGWIEDPRLQDPEDVLCIELELALSRNIRVVPVLIHNASDPRSGELPATLAPLAKRHGHPLHHRSWRSDLQPLVEVVRKALGTTQPQFEAADVGSEPDLPSDGRDRTGHRGGRSLMATIFFSAPQSEFASEAAAIEQALEASNLPVRLWRHEFDAPASVDAPQEVWRRALEDSDMYVGLFGRTLGRWARREFEDARDLGLRTLVLASADMSPEVAEFIESISNPKTGVSTAFFESAEDAAALATRSVNELLITGLREASERRAKIDGSPHSID